MLPFDEFRGDYPLRPDSKTQRGFGWSVVGNTEIVDDGQPIRRRFGGALWHLADLVRAEERGRSFRSKAYRRAVWSLDDLTPDLEEPGEELRRVSGIGPGVATLIEEFKATGTMKQLEVLDTLYPREVARMRRLPRVNPTLLRALKAQLGVETIEDLEQAAKSGALRTLRGLGETTIALWSRILDLSPGPGMTPSHQAWALARQLREHLERHLDTMVAEAGQVRRVEDWVAWIDLVVASEDPPHTRRFLELTAVASRSDPVDERIHRFRTHDDIGVTVHLTAPHEFGTSLLRATGPEDHVAEVLSDGDGSFPTEVEAYQERGIAWIPPAARSLDLDRAEDVVRVADLRGDLHVHTDWSPDGRMSLLEMARACLARGYRYVLVSDHTKGLRFGGLDEKGVERQASLIAKVRAALPELALFHGAELNIDPSGQLDLADSTLGGLDLAVAAVHSRFDLGREDQTRRVITALHNPVVRVLAHPTGRRIGIRPPLELDLDAVFAMAAEQGVALELNGHRDRLDLSAELAERALLAGCRLAANSDAHRLGELFNVENAIALAQHVGVRRDQVVNTLELDDFLAWLGAQ